jgi:hypothetical protein
MTDSDNIGGPATLGRDNGDNLSWQRVDFGGRHAGLDYFDRRVTGPAPQTRLGPEPSSPAGFGRLLEVVGLIIALTGGAGWLWMVLAFVSSIGAGNMPDDPWGTHLAGIPLSTGGLVAILIGGLLAAIGSSVTRIVRGRTGRIHWVDPNQS